MQRATDNTCNKQHAACRHATCTIPVYRSGRSRADGHTVLRCLVCSAVCCIVYDSVEAPSAQRAAQCSLCASLSLDASPHRGHATARHACCMPVWLNKSCGRALSRDFALRSNSRESLRRAAASASVQRLLYFTQARPRARAARNIALRDFKTACDGRRVPIGSDRIGFGLVALADASALQRVKWRTQRVHAKRRRSRAYSLRTRLGGSLHGSCALGWAIRR